MGAQLARKGKEYRQRLVLAVDLYLRMHEICLFAAAIFGIDHTMPVTK
jgi:hypothetical protein